MTLPLGKLPSCAYWEKRRYTEKSFAHDIDGKGALFNRIELIKWFHIIPNDKKGCVFVAQQTFE
jgi:hypothetical protein